MFKPHFGVCKCHNEPNVIVVKAGWCKRGNEEKKKAAKAEKVARQVKAIKRNDDDGISKLKDRLDAVFSLYIRYRESKDGMNQCITCRKWLLIKDLQDGHYESRRFLALRWDEKNNHPQCYDCNIRKNGNYPEYTLRMIEMYGKEFLDQLTVRKHNTTHLTRFEYKILILDFTKKLNDAMAQTK